MTHPLKDWLGRQTPPKTVKDFAADLGVHPITLRRLFNAEDSTTRELLEKIETATGGELKAVDLYVRFLSDRAERPTSHTDARASA